MAIDALDEVEGPATMPIILRPQFIFSARAGRRSHIFASASYVPGSRTGLTPRKGVPIPTRFASLKPGDRLWVQEEYATLHDRKRIHSRAFYVLELKGGHVPVPGGAKGDRYTTAKYAAKDLRREDSRYTLEVTAVRLCRAQEITWDEVRREGTHDNPYSTLGTWWGWQYGILMPWAHNPAVIGLDFKFIDGNIDSGERWAPAEKPEPRRNAYLDRMAATAPGCPHEKCPSPASCIDACSNPKQFGTPPVKD